MLYKVIHWQRQRKIIVSYLFIDLLSFLQLTAAAFASSQTHDYDGAARAGSRQRRRRRRRRRRSINDVTSGDAASFLLAMRIRVAK
jgi:hypothetical protein